MQNQHEILLSLSIDGLKISVDGRKREMHPFMKFLLNTWTKVDCEDGIWKTFDPPNPRATPAVRPKKDVKEEQPPCGFKVSLGSHSSSDNDDNDNKSTPKRKAKLVAKSDLESDEFVDLTSDDEKPKRRKRPRRTLPSSCRTSRQVTDT